MACNTASNFFLDMLGSIEPSKVTEGVLHYPCKLRLLNGLWVDYAICTEDARGFTSDWWIHPDDVAEIVPSYKRLPAVLASKLYGAGESGMGYEVFEVSAEGRERFSCVTYNVVDFPALPDGLITPQIHNVYPHRGHQWYGSPRCFDKPPEFIWCYFTF
jgi:hypothetical protein